MKADFHIKARFKNENSKPTEKNVPHKNRSFFVVVAVLCVTLVLAAIVSMLALPNIEVQIIIDVFN